MGALAEQEPRPVETAGKAASLAVEAVAVGVDQRAQAERVVLVPLAVLP